MNEAEIQEIEIDIENAKSMVSLGEALDRLHKNPDFLAIIRNGYFLHEPARLTSLKAHPSQTGDTEQADIVRQLDGIGALQQHFQKIWAQANLSQQAIAEGEKSIAEIVLEDAS